jgi:hypothetical protein
MTSEYPTLDIQSIPELVLHTDRASFFALVSPKTAKSILEENNYENQRPENKAKKNQLACAMKDGSFQPVSTIVFCVDNEKVILVNGQHTLSAMRETDLEYILPIQIYREKPKIIYPKIDRGKTRSLTDAIRTSNIAVTIGMSEAASARIARGVKVILEDYLIKGTSRTYISEDVIIDTVITNYQQAANRFYSIIDHLEYAHKLVAQIPMSLFLTLYTCLEKEDHQKVDDFAFGCASNVGLMEGDPRRLVYVMYADYVRWGGANKRARMTRKEETAILLGCWSNWYVGKERLIRYREKELDSVLNKRPNVAGTDKYYKLSTRS